MVSYHPPKFGGHKHCGSGDMFLICRVTSKDHMTQEPYDFIGRSLLGKTPPLYQVWYL